MLARRQRLYDRRMQRFAQDRFAVVPAATGIDIAALLGKTVTIAGVLPQAPKGKLTDTLRYNTITEAR